MNLPRKNPRTKRARMEKIPDLNKEKFQQRLSTGSKMFIILFAILLTRLWYLQIIHGMEYTTLSQKNSIKLIRLHSARGEVMDRHGKVLIENRPAFNVLIFRSGEGENNSDWDELSPILKQEINISDFPLRKFAALKKDVSWEEVVWIKERKDRLREVSIAIQPKRCYPHGRTASHILGYVGEINETELTSLTSYGYRRGDMIGKSGVEKSFEEWLRGKDGGKQVLVNAHGYQMDILGCKEPLPGNNIWLTIDYQVQKIIKEQIGQKRGSIIVIDPRNGEILGLVSQPNFDPDVFIRGISNEEWRKLSANENAIFTNRAIQGEYPPASTFKLIVAIAALEEGLIDTNQEFVCTGSYQVGNRPFRCWKKKGHGSLNITEAIIHSCDIFFYQLGKRVGAEKIALYAKKLGLGTPTGIDIPGEKAGLIPSPRWKKAKLGTRWYSGDTANTSIGQGFVLTTPLQMANAYAVLANGGTLYRPHILNAFLTSEGTVVKRNGPQIIRDLKLKPHTVKILREAFTSVVSRGTGVRAKVSGIKVAGKTGTAENPHGADHAWFIGFAPADSPTVCVCVMLENAGHGSVACAPLCGKIIKKILNLK